jgi:hypothetical protein
VVEEALDTAEASAIIKEALSRAKATLVAHPAGGQRANRCARDTLAAPTLLADKEVITGMPYRLLSFSLQSTIDLWVGPCSRLGSDDGLA